MDVSHLFHLLIQDMFITFSGFFVLCQAQEHVTLVLLLLKKHVLFTFKILYLLPQTSCLVQHSLLVGTVLAEFCRKALDLLPEKLGLTSATSL